MKVLDYLIVFASLFVTISHAMAAGSEPDGSERLWQLNNENLATAGADRAQRHYEGSLPDAQELEALLAREAAGDPEDLYRLGLAYENSNLWEPDYKKAFSYFERSERLGFPWAKAQLGYYYEMGLAGDKDYKKAVRLYQQGADFGDIWSGLRLGYMYLEGLGIRQHDGQAFFWIQWASRGGSAQATASLGYLHGAGRGTKVDLQEAARLYQQAGDNGFPGGWTSLGLMHELGELGTRDLVKAVRYYSQAADAGDPRGTHHLGTMYYWGLGVEPDAKRGFALYEKSLGLGYAFADVSLGLAFEQGRGVDQDYAKAARHYQKALETERFPRALGYLGWLYAEGHGVEQDLAKALALYEEAAEEGDNFALTELGIGLVDGSELAGLDVDRGRRLLLKAAERDYVAAINALADMYDRGLGVAADPVDAIYWYQRAVDLGSTDAMLSLGGFYEDGTGVAQDFDRALELYNTALEKGNESAYLDLGLLHTNTGWSGHDFAIAMDHFRKSDEIGDDGGTAALGLAYFNGEWVAEDLKQSRKFFKKAAEKGHTMAAAYLGYMQEEYLGGGRRIKKAAKNYEIAASGDNLYAVQRLAYMYANGRAVKQNAETALKWQIRAGELGDAEAAYEAALKLVERDIEKAASLLRVAANDGNLDASVKWAKMHILGHVEGANYFSGIEELVGISQAQPLSALEPLSQLIKVETSGTVYSRPQQERDLFLGIAYANGIIFPQDLEQAEIHLRKVLDVKHPLDVAPLALAQVLMLKSDYHETRDEQRALLERAANRGISAAALQLAYSYDSKNMRSQDRAKVALWYRGAAEANPFAKLRLAELEMWGELPGSNKKAAIETLENMAAAGHADAAYVLSEALTSSPVGLDYARSEYYGRKSLRLGHRDAGYVLGWLHINGKIEGANWEDALTYLTDAAERGSVRAMFLLGDAYAWGLIGKRDPQLGRQWLLKAAEAGDANAQVSLGTLLVLPGDAENNDWEEGVRWLERASGQGDAFGHFILGSAKLRGRGTERNPVEAETLFNRITAFNPALGELAAGDFDYYGGNGKPDYELAQEHYLRSAELGEPYARLYAAWHYQFGIGVKSDLDAAARLHRLNAEDDFHLGSIELAKLMRDGAGLRKDQKEAVAIFRELAAYGSVQARANLGWMLLHGFGVEQDVDEGLALIGETAEQGDIDGLFYMASILEEGVFLPKDLERAITYYQRAGDYQSYPAFAALKRLNVAHQSLELEIPEKFRVSSD